MYNSVAARCNNAGEYIQAMRQHTGLGKYASGETISFWIQQWASMRREPFPSSSPVDVQAAIVDRFFRLAFARSLQAYRATDINIVREFVDGGYACNRKFSPTAYKNRGAVQGQEQGTDNSGYAFKRWYLADADRAKDVLKENRIKPFKASAIEYLLSQRYARIEREP